MGNIMKSIQIRFGVILSIIFTIISCEKEEQPLVTEITIDSPVMYETVNGIIDISILVSSDIDIFKVELWVDSVNTGLFDDSEPYTISLNTEEYDDGLTSLFIRAYSSTRNVGDSDPILVEINNHPDFEILTDINLPLTNYINYLDILDNGAVWVGNWVSNVLYKFENDIWDEYELPEVNGEITFIDEIAINKDTVWIGTTRSNSTDNLVKMFDDSFTFYSVDSLDVYDFVAMAVDLTDQVWLTTVYGKIIKFNGQSFDVWSPSDHWSNSTHMFNGDDASIRKIVVDENNTIWFAGYSYFLGNIIASYSGNGWEVYNVPGPQQGEGAWVGGLSIDKHDNKWVGLAGAGLLKLSSGLSWTVYDTVNSYLADSFYKDVYADDYGTLWLGTSDRGLVSYNTNSNKWNVYNAENSEQIFPKIYEVQGAGKILWARGFGETSGLVRFTLP